jgi:hypothetical protein
VRAPRTAVYHEKIATSKKFSGAAEGTPISTGLEILIIPTAQAVPHRTIDVVADEVNRPVAIGHVQALGVGAAEVMGTSDSGAILHRPKRATIVARVAIIVTVVT